MPAPVSPPPRRPWLRLTLVALVVALAGCHLLFWYAPRERSGVPGSVGERVLAAEGFPIRFWLAYPHQNVSELERAIPDFDTWLGSMSRLAGVPELVAPSFGPYRVPPAGGLAVATAGDGQAFLAGADVYPMVAILARVAGKLAGNPWLAGGVVEIEGRPAAVRWEGLRGWWVASDGQDLPSGTPGGTEPDTPAIAWIRVRETVGFLPEGTIRVDRKDGGLEAVREGPPGPEPPAFSATDGPILAVLAPARLVATGQGGLVLWADAAGGLPGLAVLNGPGGRWQLPGEDLLALAGGGAVKITAGEFEIQAYDRATAERTAALAPLLRPGGVIDALDAWVDPAPAAREVRRVKELLTALPLFSKREVQRWRDLDAALRPLAGQGPITLHLALDPPAFRLRFSPSAQPRR